MFILPAQLKLTIETFWDDYVDWLEWDSYPWWVKPLGVFVLQCCWIRIGQKVNWQVYINMLVRTRDRFCSNGSFAGTNRIPSHIYKTRVFFPASLILLSILTSGKTYPVRQRTVTDSPTWYRSFTGDTTELGVTFPGHSITTRENNSKSSST